MKNPWKKIKSRYAHENPWYKVREDDVIRPDGKEGKYFVVDHEKSVVIIAEDKDKKIWMTGQTRYPLGDIFSWELVSGGVDDGDFLETAKKELKEEAGLVADEWEKIGHFYPLNGFVNEKCTVFLARDLQKTEQELEPTEDIQIKKESLETILDMIAKNEITDGIAISAIHKYLHYIKRI